MTRGRVVAAVVVVALVALVWLGARVSPRSIGPDASSRSHTPYGTTAFRRLLEGQEIRTLDWTSPWRALPAGADRPEGDAGAPSLMIVATPLERAVGHEEIPALRSWLTAGGNLLVVDDRYFGLESDVVLDRFLEEIGLDGNLPLPDGVESKFRRPEREAGSTTDALGTPRLDDVRLQRYGAIRPTLDAIPLVVARSGHVQAAEASVGRGRVVRVAGPLLGNRRLLEGDGLALALRLVDDLAGDGAVAFDEFHHGFGGRFAGVVDLDARGLWWARLQAVFAAVLYLLARGRRFGTADAPPAARRRSHLEFVRAMAEMYRRAKAHGYVVGAELHRFLRLARARFGLPETMSVDGVARAVESATGRDDVDTVLSAATDAAESSNVTKGTMVARTHALATMEREIFGGSRTGS